jgi:hypothetical protein
VQEIPRLLEAPPGPLAAPAPGDGDRQVIWCDPFSRRRFAGVPAALAARLDALAAASGITVREQLLALVNLSARRRGFLAARRRAVHGGPLHERTARTAHRLLVRDVADAVNSMGCATADVALACGLAEDDVWLLARRHGPRERA